MANDMKKVRIQLKARDLAERALIAYYVPECPFHDDQLNAALDAMVDVIADYQTETLDDKGAI